VVNFLIRRICQVTLALVVCLPALLLADTFSLPGGQPFGAKAVFKGSKVSNPAMTSIQAIVHEFRTTSQRSQPQYAAEIKVSGHTVRRAKRVLKFERSQNHPNNYMTAAYLAIQMIGIDRSTAFGRSQAGVLNNALWGRVRPDVNIWKPKPKAPRDPNVRVPEPSLASLLAFHALVLTILGLVLRRRRGIEFVD